MYLKRQSVTSQILYKFMEPIIEVKGIGKRYNITHHQGGYITLRDVLANAFKKPFSFLKTKTKEILGIDTKEIFWALKDINFAVQKGEVIGIIGHNGAGKSTLLKILSQITPPTEGEIRINGTVGSLLEVGTGFHPELTGRENIFLNGAILGMQKKDIVKKFDEIVKFADIEKFLDTPVKYYSNGMYVRLAFSVAAHMDTDILIIDEVLAVGDAEFQKKCLGKMEDITKKEGRTILFVSHNMGAIRELCDKTILLDKGKIDMFGKTNEVINYYSNLLLSRIDNNLKLDNDFMGIGGIVVKNISIINNIEPQEGGSYSIELEWESNIHTDISVIDCGLAIHNENEILVTRLSSQSIGFKLETSNKKGKWLCSIDKNLLPRGIYHTNIRIDSSRGLEYWKINAFSFNVNPGSFQNNVTPLFHNHIFHQPHNWINK